MIHQLTDRLQGAGIGVHRLSAADEQEIQRLGGDTAAVHAWLRSHPGGAEGSLHLQMLSTPDMFWSNAEQAVRTATQERATPRQWLGMLRSAGGIKAGEDRWTGLSEEFRSRVAAADDSWQTGQQAVDAYCTDMRSLYGTD